MKEFGRSLDSWGPSYQGKDIGSSMDNWEVQGKTQR